MSGWVVVAGLLIWLAFMAWFWRLLRKIEEASRG